MILASLPWTRTLAQGLCIFMKADEMKADDEMKANEKSQQYFFLNNFIKHQKKTVTITSNPINFTSEPALSRTIIRFIWG